MYKKFLSLTLLSCVLSILGFAEETSFKVLALDEPPPKVAHYVIGNWNNLMDPRGCVLLESGNNLKVKGIISLGVNSLAGYPPMHVYVNFDGVDSFTTPAIQDWQLEPLTLLNGQVVYTYTFTAFEHEFGEECSQSPETPISLNYEITAVDDAGNPYPIEDNMELLTPTSPPDPGMNPTTIIYNTSSYQGVKDLCCFGTSGNMGTERIVQDNGTTPIDLDFGSNAPEVIQDASVFPNPFSEALNIQFQLSAPEPTTIQLWDINGRLVYQSEYTPDRIGAQQMQINTDQLEAGFYYCNIKNNTQVETLKVLKLAR